MSLNSPWLSEWRTFADRTQMSDQEKRAVQAAIRGTEQHWTERHREAYRDRAERRFSARDEKVIGACDEMSSRLAEIRRDVRAGRLSPKDARSEVRSMRGRYLQAVDLHDTLVSQEDELKTFAEMSPDDYQRETIEKFPVLMDGAPTLGLEARRLAAIADRPSWVPADHTDAPGAAELGIPLPPGLPI